jgi:hypothetical protein
MSGSKWLKYVVISGVLIAWQIYDLATAVEAAPPALVILQYGLLAVTLVSFVGSLMMFVKERRGERAIDLSAGS